MIVVVRHLNVGLHHYINCVAPQRRSSSPIATNSQVKRSRLPAWSHYVRSPGDIRDLDAVRAVVQGYDVVVNAAAWTAVDAAEAQEPAAFAVNAVGARNVALAAREAGARMVQISTDYVFDGSATTPFAADHPQAPCSAYGRTKAAGEWALRLADPNSMVVRTAWLYGDHGRSFVKTMLRLAEERETISVVDDQTGQPT
jgi:dTDP-4-dehydrorhamnose reductase